MFKKAIILFVAVLYINVSAGIGVQFHYCMGEIVSMAFGHHSDHEEACGDCGMDANESSCCKDESLLLKVKDGHQPSSFFPFDKSFESVWSDRSGFIFPALINTERNDDFSFCRQHRQLADKLYISIRVLRI